MTNQSNAFELLAELQRLTAQIQDGTVSDPAATAQRIPVLIKDLAFNRYYGMRNDFFENLLRVDKGAAELARAVYEEEDKATGGVGTRTGRFKGYKS